MNLPTEEQSLACFSRYNVPKNIQEHCLKVKEVAVFLAKKLRESGVEINVELVDRSALFHDLFKVVILEKLEANLEYHPEEYSAEEISMWEKLRKKYRGLYENEVAYEILRKDYPELAAAVKNSSDPRNQKKSWEETIVHYADWRVFKESVVQLNERLDYFKQRYPKNDDIWNQYKFVIKDIENKIFTNLDFTPELLKENLQNGR